jgi:hypothetical protein
MKNSTKMIKLYSMMVMVLFALLLNSTSIKAQSDDEDEEESSFFSDGINSSRFESNLNSDYSTQRPTYEGSSRRSSSTEIDYNNTNTQNYYKELDLEVHREPSSSGGAVIGGGGGGGSMQNNNSTTNNGVGNIPPKVNPNHNPGDVSIPDNPGDPDAPIDGGIGFLIAAGLGYGVKKMKSNKKK